MLRNVKTRSLLATILLLLASSSTAQQAFESQVTVSLVQVPVQVLRGGEPVRGLSRENFEVFEDRKRRPIESFEIIDLQLYESSTEAAAVSEPVPLAGRRRFLFLFDLSNVEPRSLSRARDAALQLVHRGLHGSDLAAVATYRAQRGAQLILGFTSDREQLALALTTLGSPELVDRSPDPLRIVLGAARSELDSVLSNVISGGAGDKALEIATAALGEAQTQVALALRLEEDEERNRIQNLSASFAEMAKLLAQADGRKYVVLLSEGFDTDVVFSNVADEASRAASEHGEIWEIDADRTFGSTATQADLQEMISSFQRADCVIESIDIGGLRGQGELSRGNEGREGLFYLANETGGELIESFNDLGEAMGEMLERTSVTYLLTFEPRHQEADGSYHPIEVRLRGVEGNARALHRPGYVAPRPFEYRNSIEKSMSLADRIVGGEVGGEILTEVAAATMAGIAGKARVPLVVEVDGESLLQFHLGRLLNAEIYVYAMDREGRVAGFLSQLVGLDLDQHRQILQQTGLRFFGDLELEPGDYQLRILVRNHQASTFGIHQADLRVPDFSPGEPALDEPLLLAPPGGWILVREPSSGGYPFVVGDQMLLPTSSRHLRELDRLVFWWQAHDLATEGLHPEARLTALSGAAAPELRWLERGVSDAPGRRVFAAEVDPRLLPPGEYGLELVLHDGDRELTSTRRLDVLE